MNSLIIKGLDFNINWKNKSENFDQITRITDKMRCDIFLLPEMFSTGFCMDAEEIADQYNETLAFLKNLAQKRNFAVGGSASVQENGIFYNRFYFVKPDGTYEKYDKRHLFSYSGEDTIYTPGTERIVVNYKDFRILLQVCYDLRFPVFSRNKNDYDAVFYVANWPESRIDAWNTLLKARAIENQCYVFGLNRIGTDGNNLFYPESSCCYFADGSTVSEVDGPMVSAELDLEKLNRFREKFPFLADQDEFDLK